MPEYPIAPRSFAIPHHGRGTRLLLDRRPEIPVLQGMLFEESIRPRGAVAAVERDGPIRPLTRQAQLTPGVDRLAAALVRARKDAVKLVQRQALDRVVLVRKHRQGINSDFDFRGFVAIFLLKGVDFCAFISRLIGPNCAVPSINAGGAWMSLCLRSGYSRWDRWPETLLPTAS